MQCFLPLQRWLPSIASSSFTTDHGSKALFSYLEYLASRRRILSFHSNGTPHPKFGGKSPFLILVSGFRTDSLPWHKGRDWSMELELVSSMSPPSILNPHGVTLSWRNGSDMKAPRKPFLLLPLGSPEEDLCSVEFVISLLWAPTPTLIVQSTPSQPFIREDFRSSAGNVESIIH